MGPRWKAISLAALNVVMLSAGVGCSGSEERQFSPAQVDNVAASASQSRNASPLWSFESGVPAAFAASRPESLTVAEGPAKAGRRALRWIFSEGEHFTIQAPIPLLAAPTNQPIQQESAFVAWVYSPVALPGKTHFMFSQMGNAVAEFSMTMNFSGWRALIVPFSDMRGQVTADMDSLTILPPQGVTNGELRFDLMSLSLPVDPRWPTTDDQIQVNHEAFTAANAHWTALALYQQWLDQASDTLTQPSVQAQDNLTADKKVISQRIDDTLLDRLPDTEALTALRQSVTTEATDYSQWRPILMTRQREIYAQAGVSTQDLAEMDTTTTNFRQAGKYLLALAKAFRLTDNQQLRQYYLQQFRSMCHHLIQQGFVKGSGQGGIHHQGYAMREWADALFLMRDHLGDVRPAMLDALAWYTGFGRIYRPKQDIVGFNVDVMNTFLPAMLYVALMTKDNAESQQRLATMREWMSFSLTQIKGLAGGIQADGSFFHHSQHYVAYANGGLSGLAPVIYYLSRTGFAVSDAAYTRVKQALLKSTLYSNDLRIPLSLSGRHPDGEQVIVTAPLQFLARAVNQDAFDAELASTYLRLVPENDRWAQTFRQAGLKAAAIPNGAWAMNYSNLLVYRQQDWLLTARGFNRYLVGNESYANANLFGRYLNYGQVEIAPARADDRAFSEPGWDWNRWPGSTSVHLPLMDLKARLSRADEAAGVEEMLLSDQTFSGANVLGEKAAMFAINLHGHPKYDDSFRAQKAVFVFDNRMIALGAGIQTQDNQHRTETTLFQQALSAPYGMVNYNGQSLGLMALDSLATSSGSGYLLDGQGNGYYLPKGQQLRLIQQMQLSRNNEDTRDTQGMFATALIDHGRSPQQASYEYAVLIHGGETATQEFVEQMSSPKTAAYQVIENSPRAQIVRDNISQTLGYALYRSGDVSDHAATFSPLLGVDAPVMLMMRPVSQAVSEPPSSWQLALTNPDMGLYQGQDPEQYDAQGKQREVSIYSRPWRYNPPQVKTSVLTLAGQWQLAPVSESCPADATNIALTVTTKMTRVAVRTKAAKPVRFCLQAVQ